MSQAVWLFRTRSIRKRAKEAEIEWDEFPEAQAWQGNGRQLPWSRKDPKVEMADMTTGEDGTRIETADGLVPTGDSRTRQDQIGDTEQCKQL